MNNKNNSSRLMRWSIKMQEFNFEIKHRPGRLNCAADALSRNPIEKNKILLTFKRRKLNEEENINVEKSEKLLDDERPVVKKDVILDCHTQIGHANLMTT
jgi:hypothetical protein